MVRAIGFKALAAALSLAAPASSTSHYPVPYTFLANIAAAPFGPNTPPPGADNWSCVPSAAHPYPVILVHGLLANETDNWQTYGPLLADNGYCVYSLTYGNNPTAPPPFDDFGGLARMEQSAQVLGTFVDRVLAATHAAKVDLVGHSEGATMPYWYIKFDGGAAKVADMVGLAPVVHGTDVATLTLLDTMLPAVGQSPSFAPSISSACASCAEFSPSSAFIQKLDAGGITMPGVAYTQIVTQRDELVVPYTSGVVDAPDSTNFVVQDQCALDQADHVSLASDPIAAQDVLNALDPAQTKTVPCVPVAPFVG